MESILKSSNSPIKVKTKMSFNFKEIEPKASTDAVKKINFKSSNLNVLSHQSKKHIMDNKMSTGLLKQIIQKQSSQTTNLINKKSTKQLAEAGSSEDLQDAVISEYSRGNLKKTTKNMKNENQNLYQKIHEEMDSLFVEAMKLYFIDSMYNLPEYYEEYLIQNLKVIKRMLFFLNEESYDDEYNKRLKMIEDNIDLDYSMPYLLIDLDETLIHSEVYKEENQDKYHKIIDVPYNDGTVKIQRLGIYIRPGSKEFLEWANQYFKLVLFTAAEGKYAKLVLEECKFIQYFSSLLDREYTIVIKKFHLKDLSIFNGSEKLNCLLLDNNIFSMASSLSQGILISSFYTDPTDTELNEIKKYLEEKIITNIDDMINTNSEHFMYQELMLRLEFETQVDDD